MKKVIYSYMLLLFILLQCCTLSNPKEREINSILGEIIQINNLQQVYLGDFTQNFTEYRKQFKFISVVYLQNDCAPCYPKFIKWQNWMDSHSIPENYTVLFIIQGDKYSEFIDEVTNYAINSQGNEQFISHYPVIMDPNFDFLSSNSSTPRWIIDSSVLIDEKNRIRMVGLPWVNKEMTGLLHRICKK